ncbi:MAG: hypothetical protein ACRDC6_13330, partial [Shewanella sp.]
MLTLDLGAVRCQNGSPFLLYYWNLPVNQSHSGHWANTHAQVGLLFISVSVLFWGMLPIALK